MSRLQCVLGPNVARYHSRTVQREPPQPTVARWSVLPLRAGSIRVRRSLGAFRTDDLTAHSSSSYSADLDFEIRGLLLSVPPRSSTVSLRLSPELEPAVPIAGRTLRAWR